MALKLLLVLSFSSIIFALQEGCPPGSYPEGSKCELCPSGTFQPDQVTVGGRELCRLCPAGTYCSKAGLAAAEGDCLPGYYCPQGSASQTAVLCPRDYYCETGSSVPKPCKYYKRSDPGSYSCKWRSDYCPPGTYNTWNNCSYCPEGYFQTSWIYRPNTDSNVCQPCPLGYYCSAMGASAPTGPCSAAGWYCPMGSESMIKTVCPQDFYCPGVVDGMLPCPEGTYSQPGAKSISDCKKLPDVICPGGMFVNGSTCQDCPKGTYIQKNSEKCQPCDAGKYCMYPKATATTGKCRKGHYCPEGSTHPTPTACPENYSCPPGSAFPMRCRNGTVSRKGSSAYEDCVYPNQCLKSSSDQSKEYYGGTKNCGPGKYTLWNSCYDCPIGTYQPGWSNCKDEKEVCLWCEPGKYCDQTGLAAPTGSCAPGFYCPIGSTNRTSSMCPFGHYCPVGATSPIACPDGTTSIPGSTSLTQCKGNDTVCPEGMYRNGGICQACTPGTFKNHTGDEPCQFCPAGKYCSRYANIQATGRCEEGYYCPQGSTHPRQKLCPDNHYCYSGSGEATPCRSGLISYAGSARSSDCDSDVPAICSTGYYSSNGVCISCPKGTYKPKEGRQGLEGCLLCPEGKFCDKPEAVDIKGNCSSGYFCSLGSNSAAPTVCPPNHYCPVGSGIPTSCPLGKHSPPGASKC